MDNVTTTFTRLDSSEPLNRPRTLDQLTDADIQAATAWC